MFVKYFDEIRDIAVVNNVAWDVGLDMFVNNIEDALVENDEHFYHGADHVDYAALKVEWDAMDREQKVEAMNEFVKFVKNK